MYCVDIYTAADNAYRSRWLISSWLTQIGFSGFKKRPGDTVRLQRDEIKIVLEPIPGFGRKDSFSITYREDQQEEVKAILHEIGLKGNPDRSLKTDILPDTTDFLNSGYLPAQYLPYPYEFQ